MEQKSNSIKCKVVHLHTNKNCSLKMEAFQPENRYAREEKSRKLRNPTLVVLKTTIGNSCG